MTIEEVKEIEDSIKEHSGVYPPWTNDVCHLGAGMDIIRKYTPKPPYAASHDQLFYGNWNESYTREDMIKLFELNWRIDNEYGDNSFYHFT